MKSLEKLLWTKKNLKLSPYILPTPHDSATPEQIEGDDLLSLLKDGTGIEDQLMLMGKNPEQTSSDSLPEKSHKL